MNRARGRGHSSLHLSFVFTLGLGCALAGSASQAADIAKSVRGEIPETGITRISRVGPTTVFKTLEPERRLDFVVMVSAKAKDVWSALTTVKGFQSFYAPGGRVELRPGGPFEVHQKPDAPPGERGMEGTKVLSFVPGLMLSGTGSAPPEFPTVQKEKTKWIILLDEVGSGTRVQMSMIEWGSGDEWTRAFDYFAENNPEFLNALYELYSQGPVDWKKRGVDIKEPSADAERDVPKMWRVDKSLDVRTDYYKLWDLFTTNAGLERWAAPSVNVDLRFDGPYERLDKPSAPGGRRGQEGTRILTYLPRELISYTWLAPPQFPEVREGQAWETWRFYDLGDGWVRLRYAAVGLGDGTQWRDAFNILDQRMDFVMGNLRTMLTN